MKNANIITWIGLELTKVFSYWNQTFNRNLNPEVPNIKLATTQRHLLLDIQLKWSYFTQNKILRRNNLMYNLHSSRPCRNGMMWDADLFRYKLNFKTSEVDIQDSCVFYCFQRIRRPCVFTFFRAASYLQKKKISFKALKLKVKLSVWFGRVNMKDFTNF
jgi:hypothetical protein